MWSLTGGRCAWHRLVVRSVSCSSGGSCFRLQVAGLLGVLVLGTASLAACSGGGPTASSGSASPHAATSEAEATADAVVSGAASGPRGSDAGGDYLALGDSVPFGYDPAVAVGAAASRYTGYPELAAPQLGLRLTNLSCPGESTGSLIDVNALDKGCARFRYAASLHVRYDGSQLQAALAFLESRPRTRLVTLTIGANDIALCAQGSPDGGCRDPQRFAKTLTEVSTNVGRILDAVRSRYRGPLVVVTYYSTTTDAVEVAGREGLDGALVRQAVERSADVVDGFAAFRSASAAAGGDPCAAHLLLPDPTGGCDSHPSRAGAQLLAVGQVADVRSRPSPLATTS